MSRWLLKIFLFIIGVELGDESKMDKAKIYLILKTIGFYVLSWTWGAIMSLIGAVAVFALWISGRAKVGVFHRRIYAQMYKGNWGGVSLGCFFICSHNSSDTLKAHECGHMIQNAILGPFMPFVVGIPSMIRYWYRELKYNRKGKVPPTSYDAIWFEGQATRIGVNYILTDRL